MLYKYLLKPLLFLLDAESAHQLTAKSFSIILRIPIISHLVKWSLSYHDKKLETSLWGINFPNRVGLAAGFDKDGKHFEAMSALGFGFLEIGTVTPKPQEGNAKPRLFRLPEDEGLINRMGFNNEGVETLVNRLIKRKNKNIIIGGNIGKNKLTPNANAIEDYHFAFEKLYDHVDYFVVNVSSPNTPGLRELQGKEPLTKLLRHLITLRDSKPLKKPVLLKIAPDLSDEQLEDIFDILKNEQLDGVIATNTTISRDHLKTSTQTLNAIGNGGLSGKPLTRISRNIVKKIRDNNSEIPIIGAGGINSPEDAQKMIDSGANLIQVYSGLIYQGPTFVKNIKKHLSKGI